MEELKYYSSGKITFSVGQIAQYASEYGIENYMIRVYFVSERYGSTLDYAITIDAHNWVQGTLISLYYDKENGEEQEQPNQVKYCSVCGIIADIGYVKWEYIGETEGVYSYHGYKAMNGTGYILETSTPIENIEIPPVEGTL